MCDHPSCTRHLGKGEDEAPSTANLQAELAIHGPSSTKELIAHFAEIGLTGIGGIRSTIRRAAKIGMIVRLRGRWRIKFGDGTLQQDDWVTRELGS